MSVWWFQTKVSSGPESQSGSTEVSWARLLGAPFPINTVFTVSAQGSAVGPIWWGGPRNAVVSALPFWGSCLSLAIQVMNSVPLCFYWDIPGLLTKQLPGWKACLGSEVPVPESSKQEWGIPLGGRRGLQSQETAFLKKPLWTNRLWNPMHFNAFSGLKQGEIEEKLKGFVGGGWKRLNIKVLTLSRRYRTVQVW